MLLYKLILCQCQCRELQQQSTGSACAPVLGARWLSRPTSQRYPRWGESLWWMLQSSAITWSHSEGPMQLWFSTVIFDLCSPDCTRELTAIAGSVGWVWVVQLCYRWGRRLRCPQPFHWHILRLYDYRWGRQHAVLELALLSTWLFLYSCRIVITRNGFYKNRVR